MGKRELIALLNLPRGCLQFVIVVFPDHTHLLFSNVFVCLFLFSILKIKFDDIMIAYYAFQI